jgi:hypothetical protein
VDGLGGPDLGDAGLIWALPALLAPRVPLSSAGACRPDLGFAAHLAGAHADGCMDLLPGRSVARACVGGRLRT